MPNPILFASTGSNSARNGHLDFFLSCILSGTPSEGASWLWHPPTVAAGGHQAAPGAVLCSARHRSCAGCSAAPDSGWSFPHRPVSSLLNFLGQARVGRKSVLGTGHRRRSQVSRQFRVLKGLLKQSAKFGEAPSQNASGASAAWSLIKRSRFGSKRRHLLNRPRSGRGAPLAAEEAQGAAKNQAPHLRSNRQPQQEQGFLYCRRWRRTR